MTKSIQPYRHAINCAVRSLNGPCTCGLLKEAYDEAARREHEPPLDWCKPTAKQVDEYVAAHGYISRQSARARLIAANLLSATEKAHTVLDLRRIVAALIRVTRIET